MSEQLTANGLNVLERHFLIRLYERKLGEKKLGLLPEGSKNAFKSDNIIIASCLSRNPFSWNMLIKFLQCMYHGKKNPTN